MYIRKGGEWRAPQSCKVRKGNSWRSIVQIKVYASGAWREVANFTQTPAGGGGGGGGGSGGGSTSGGGDGSTGGGSITLSISPSPFSKISQNLTMTSGTLTATPTGGRAPYTYVWAKTAQSGVSATVTINSPTSASTTASATLSVDGTANVTLRCTVTDSLGTTAQASVSGSFTFLDIFTGG